MLPEVNVIVPESKSAFAGVYFTNRIPPVVGSVTVVVKFAESLLMRKLPVTPA